MVLSINAAFLSPKVQFIVLEEPNNFKQTNKNPKDQVKQVCVCWWLSADIAKENKSWYDIYT